MVKAKDFWYHLCEVLDYRFFAGIPCKGLNFLYNSMSPEFMHYVPAINEKIAVNLVNGAHLAGVKGAVFLPPEKIFSFEFNNENLLPLFVITAGKITPKGVYVLELTDDLEGCLNRMTKRKKPGVLFIREVEG